MSLQPLTMEEVRACFIEAQPTISSEIKVREAQYPNFIRDMYKISPFPLGSGTSMQEITYRGALPAIERGFDNWRKLRNNASGCEVNEGPDCAYNTKKLGGGGFERKVMELMDREFVSDTFCIKNIQTTLDFKKTFELAVQNLYSQIAFFKEQNIGFNALTLLSKKILVDSGGVKINPENPYVFRTVGTTRLSALNIYILNNIYERLRKFPDIEPMMIQDGRPVFGLIASDELLGRLYRDDPQLRQDVRESSMADSLVTKYGFSHTIEGKYIPIPYLYPRRFNIVGGEPVEVLPWINGIPLEVGSYTSVNPLYEEATHEGVIITGMSPFEIYTMPTETSLGHGSEFGPEPTFFENWQWMNFKNDTDPYGRLGYFMTSGTIGISNQYSSGLFELLVERPRNNGLATFYPEPICPPEPVACENEVADMGCPSSKVASFSQNPISGNYFVTLTTPYLVDGETEVLLALSNGGYVTATIEDVDAEPATVIEVSFAGAVPQPGDVLEVYVVDTLACSALVREYDNKGQSATDIYKLTLDKPIKAVTANDVVHVTLGDGTVIETADIESVDIPANEYVVNLDGTVIQDSHCGIIGICVPTATDASCPGCGDQVTFAACS